MPFSNIDPADFGTQLLDDITIAAIDASVEDSKSRTQPAKRVKMQVKPHLIFRV